MNASTAKVPKSLDAWFFIHFLVDYIVAVPLFLFPNQTLTLLGWHIIDPIATRLVAAALFGIGYVSLVSRHSEIITYKFLLLLKIVWSLSAVGGILLTVLTDSLPFLGWVALAVFAFFASIWIYYYSILYTNTMNNNHQS